MTRDRWNKEQRFGFWFVLTVAAMLIVWFAGMVQGAEWQPYVFGDVSFLVGGPEPSVSPILNPSKKADYAVIEVHYKEWAQFMSKGWIELHRVKTVVSPLLGKHHVGFDSIPIDIGQIVKVKVIYLNVVGTSEKDLKP